MFITQSKAWKIKVCFVAFLYSLSALAMDWSALEPYQGTRSLNYVNTILSILVKDDPIVKEYISSYVTVGNHSIQIFSETSSQNPQRKPEFELRFGNHPLPKQDGDFVYNGKNFDGLKIAIDSNNNQWNTLRFNKKDGSIKDIHYPTLTHQISNKLKSLLEENGAEVYLSRADLNGHYDWPQIVQRTNEFKPHIAIVTDFNIQKDEGDFLPGKPLIEINLPECSASQNSMVSLCPGCFRKDELKTSNPEDEYGVRFRYRFMHSIATGKPIHSVKLGMYINKACSDIMKANLMDVRESSFSDTTAGVQACDELMSTCRKLNLQTKDGYIPGIGVRNLAFTEVYANSVIYLFPNIELALLETELSSEDWAVKVAQTYYEGIKNYLKNESSNELSRRIQKRNQEVDESDLVSNKRISFPLMQFARLYKKRTNDKELILDLLRREDIDHAFAIQYPNDPTKKIEFLNAFGFSSPEIIEVEITARLNLGDFTLVNITPPTKASIATIDSKSSQEERHFLATHKALHLGSQETPEARMIKRAIQIDMQTLIYRCIEKSKKNSRPFIEALD